MKITKFVEKKHFLLYFIIIGLIFICQLMSCRTTSYETNVMGVSSDYSYEIKDSNVLESVFRISKSAPSGFMIYNYKNSGVNGLSQIIHIDFFDALSGEMYEYKAIDPIKEIGNIYIPFENKFNEGTVIRMRLWSEGFTDEGPTVSLSKESDYGNALWRNGVLSTKYLCSALYYEKTIYNFAKPIIYCVIEIIVGFLLWLLEKKLAIPFRRKKFSTFSGGFFPFSRKEKGKCKNCLLALLCIVFLVVAFLDYVYTNTVEPAIDQRNYEIVCNTKTGNQSVASVALHDGDELVQVFKAKEDRLSGIGIEFDSHSTRNGVLKCYIYDILSGDMLVEKAYDISVLRAASAYVSRKKQDAADESALSNFLFLDLQTVLNNSSDQYYKLVIRLEQLEDKPAMFTVAEGDAPALEKNGQWVSGNLCLALFYSDNYFLKEMFEWMTVIVILFIVVIYVYINVRKASVGKVFLACGLVLGFLYCFLIPPYCVPDEWAHFDTAYRLSNRIMGITEEPGPERIYKRSCDIEGERFETVNVTIEEYKNLYEKLWELADDETMRSAYANNTMGQSSIFNYLFTAIGFTIARMLHLGHVPMLVIGRLTNLIVMLLLMYAAVQKLPVGKSVFALVCLLPMTLQQMASASYDGFIIAIAYVFVAYTIYFIMKDDICILDIGVIIFSGCMLAMCKAGVYVPMLGLLLIVPIAKKTLKKRWWICTVALLSMMAMMFFAQNMRLILPYFVKTPATSFRGGSVAVYTVSYFLQFPKKLIRIYQNTIRESGDFYIGGIVGSVLGKLNISFPWFILIAFVLLLVLAVFVQKDEDVFWKWGTRFYVLLLCSASAVLVLFSMLIAWTEVGSKSIQGVQGRYFLPILGLGLLLIQNRVLVYRVKNENVLIYVACLLNILAMGFALFSII